MAKPKKSKSRTQSAEPVKVEQPSEEIKKEDEQQSDPNQKHDVNFFYQLVLDQQKDERKKKKSKQRGNFEPSIINQSTR